MPWPTVQDGVYERHDGSLEADVVTVLPSAPVKVVQNALKKFQIIKTWTALLVPMYSVRWQLDDKKMTKLSNTFLD